jgi:hypothetical protein
VRKRIGQGLAAIWKLLLTDNPRISDRPKCANAGPGLSVWITHLDPCQIPLLCKPHVDARTRVPKFRDRAFSQDKVSGRTTLGAKMILYVRVVFICSAVSSRRTDDADVRRMKIPPACAHLAAQRAVKFIDVLGSFFHRDAELTARTEERHRMTTFASERALRVACNSQRINPGIGRFGRSGISSARCVSPI